MNYGGAISGLVFGIAFGFILENAGFGSGCKLTAQLRFKDWAVFKVMFTAILVAAGGLYVLQGFGLVAMDRLFVPSVLFWGTLLGGMLVGVGMAVGSYCPGTSIVALFSGKLDAVVFLLGIGAGTLAFGGAYDSIKSWVYKQTGPDSLTLPQLFHLPAWAVWLLLLGVLVAVGYLTRESRGPGSMATPLVDRRAM